MSLPPTTRLRPLLALLLAGATLTLAAGAGAAGAATVPSNWFKGADLTSWWFDEWDNTATNASITALKATNSADAMFVATWYMSSPTDSTVAPDPLKTPDDSGLLRAMAYARSLGMRVELKLHVDVADGSFRGNIAPASVSTWFSTYTQMVDHYAALAQQAGASLLVVGTELTSMQSYASQWRSVIAAARSLFSGPITYTANWIAGAQQVSFWDALDFVGVDAYMPLSSASNPNPTAGQLVAAWSSKGYVSQLAALSAKYGKPVIFPEIGYQSEIGTAVTPWSVSGGAHSQQAQQNAYEAAYEVFSDLSWFRGFFWWDWRPSGFNPADNDFSPRGKLAAQTMTSWNGSISLGGLLSPLVPTVAAGATKPATGTTKPTTPARKRHRRARHAKHRRAGGGPGTARILMV